ncbi:DUF1127 domain-containing protein [Bradyrhizobium sp. BR 10289]|uniref:DUF1127 domain-containing protein n=1 Tax=Bradyrhizobium sp. BR 10289 TaxID=2749993 RepID=UPI001C64AACA|nr:DUF1127 domain-containing protein [Bradyrhizobium sp. BR 10289]MBW7975111.1 DUF1127 domain-containing protein [Bradyrhizobium sp. BR 10289]
MKAQSHNVARVVRLNITEPDDPGWLALSDGRAFVRLGFDRSGMQNFADKGVADIGSQPARPDAEPERSADSFWWELLFGMMEGFALYGAALHPTAAMPVHAILAATRDRQGQLDVSELPEPVQDNAGAKAGCNGNVVELDRLQLREAQPARRWNWLRAVGETVAALSAQLRREREIGRAVAALQELDDRTLRDLGIACRSEIEWTVRYCRDC